MISIQFQNKKWDMFQQPLQLSCTWNPISIRDPYWFISLAVFFRLLLWSLWEGAHATASTDWLWECRRGRQTVFIRDNLLLCCHTHTSAAFCCSLVSETPHLFLIFFFFLKGQLLIFAAVRSRRRWHHFAFIINKHPVSFVIIGLTNLLSDSRFCLCFCQFSSLSSKEHTLWSSFTFGTLSNVNVIPCSHSGRGPCNQLRLRLLAAFSLGQNASSAER